jgi:uncharacterized protein
MKEVLLEVLACPVCKGPLELKAAEKADGEVVSGSLLCKGCNHEYPISEGIPSLLPPEGKC